MNYDQLKFDMPPFSILFYATSIVCLLLILALWKLYQRNEFLADLAETRKLLAKESALHASEALSIGQQSLNALQTANKSTQRWQELNYELSEKLAAVFRYS